MPRKTILVIAFVLACAAGLPSEIFYPWKDTCIGALDAAGWPGLVIAPSADCAYAFLLRVEREGETAFNPFASSYKDAMHGRCLNCHEQKAVELDKPELALCSTCHTYYESEQLQTSLP